VIVIGVDPDKRSDTGVGVEGRTGELQAERTVKARRQGHERLLAWARTLDGERLWALEDCRQVSSALERFLLGRGERVVRVPPRLMGEARKGGRSYGKSDAIDALAVAQRRPARARPAGRLPGGDGAGDQVARRPPRRPRRRAHADPEPAALAPA
jgi:transposase